MKTPAYLLALILSFTALSAFSQDVIYMTDGSKVDGKISLVSGKTITYKKADNLNGPDFEVDKKEVLMVVYENGTNEIFNGKGKTDPRATDFGRHFVSWQFTDLLATNVTINYEYFNKSGTLGFKVPLSFGFNMDAYNYPGDPEVFGTPGRIFATALELNYYPTGQGRTKYYLGPSLGFGYNHFYNSYYLYDDINPQYYDESGYGYRFSLLINNGMMFQPTKNFNITTALGLGMAGYRFDENTNLEYYNDPSISPAVTLSVAAGYRF